MVSLPLESLVIRVSCEQWAPLSIFGSLWGLESSALSPYLYLLSIIVCDYYSLHFWKRGCKNTRVYRNFETVLWLQKKSSGNWKSLPLTSLDYIMVFCMPLLFTTVFKTNTFFSRRFLVFSVFLSYFALPGDNWILLVQLLVPDLGSYLRLWKHCWKNYDLYFN